MTRQFENPIFCALDTTDIAAAVKLAHDLRGSIGGVKLGLEFFYAHGADGYRRVAQAGLPIFLDLKLHDIPNTVTGGLKAVLPLEPAILNVHCGGGRIMMETAARVVRDWDGPKPMLIGVTVLTSLDGPDLAAVGLAPDPAAQVDRLAALARASGLDGVVCSSHEIARLRAALGPDFKLIVPGIRPAGAGVADQKRVMTPAEAFGLGADVLVIGRPITQAADPAAAARAIAGGLAAAA